MASVLTSVSRSVAGGAAVAPSARVVVGVVVVVTDDGGLLLLLVTPVQELGHRRGHHWCTRAGQSHHGVHLHCTCRDGAATSRSQHGCLVMESPEK